MNSRCGELSLVLRRRGRSGNCFILCGEFERKVGFDVVNVLKLIRHN